jgi:hypothetical protein
MYNGKLIKIDCGHLEDLRRSEGVVSNLEARFRCSGRGLFLFWGRATLRLPAFETAGSPHMRNGSVATAAIPLGDRPVKVHFTS